VDVKKEKGLFASLNVTTIPSIRLYRSGDKNNPVYCPGNVKIYIRFLMLTDKLDKIIIKKNLSLFNHQHVFQNLNMGIHPFKCQC